MQGNESVVSSLISEMNKGNFDAPSVSEEWQDIKVVTTLLKRFLKQLPDSLIVKGMYHDFITAARAPTEEGRVQRIKELIGQLPPAHFHTLRHFARHLATIEKHSQHNKVRIYGWGSLGMGRGRREGGGGVRGPVTKLVSSNPQQVLSIYVCKLGKGRRGGDVSAQRTSRVEYGGLSSLPGV